MSDGSDDVEMAASELKVSGAKQGPTLGVLINSENSAEIVSRLAALPSLAYLHGVLLIGTSFEVSEDEPIDAVLDLREQSDPVDMFWTLLARATSLGMISGRGIPARYLTDMAPLALQDVA